MSKIVLTGYQIGEMKDKVKKSLAICKCAGDSAEVTEDNYIRDSLEIATVLLLELYHDFDLLDFKTDLTVFTGGERT